MRSGSLATVLSVVAIAGLGLIYLKVDRLEERIDSGRAVTPPRDTPTPPREASKTRGEPEQVEPAPEEKTPVEDEASPAERANLEERMKKLERRVDRPDPKWRRAGNVKQLAAMLKLTETQSDRVKAVVTHGRRRIEEILKIPDASGTSPFERRRSLFLRTREALRTGEWDEVLAEIKQPGPRDEPIPGRNTTYGEEVARIVAETRDEIARNLSPEQVAKFGGTVIDPLVGAGLDPSRIVGAAKRAGPLPAGDEGR